MAGDSVSTATVAHTADEAGTSSEALHSASAGLIVDCFGQLRAGRLAQGRAWARDQALHVNAQHGDLATMFVYEETFGAKHRLHWLVQARSLDAYTECMRNGGTDERSRATQTDAGVATWEELFVDGSLGETMLLPQFTGMYGTSLEAGQDVPDRPERFGTSAAVRPAQHQVEMVPEQTLNSSTADVIIHRTGQLRYEFRGEGRQFAREVATAINAKYDGDVTVYLYEEAFGSADRIHWLIHLRSLSTYYALIDGHAWVTEKDRELYAKQRVAPEKGGGDWSRLFVEAGIRDVGLTRIVP